MDNTSSTTNLRPAGRPRIPELDEVILAAALQQLAEQGYQRMSMDAVAQTAGVSKATIYRRWASKADLAIAALATRIDAEPPIEWQKFSIAALSDVLETIRERLLQPNNMALVGTLLAEEKQTPELIALFRQHVWKRRSHMLRRILELGQEEGKIRTDISLDIVIDMLIGSMYASYLSDTDIPDGWPKQAVETMIEGIRRSQNKPTS